jgi:hypothetical protein
MRKLVGFVLHWITLIILGYAFLNESLVLVADWLSPILTGKIYSIFALIYLLIGDPIKFPNIFLIWGLTSIITGILIRKRIGTVITVITTWLFVISLLGLLTLSLVLQAQNNFILNENTNPFDIVPPLPEGLTITSLYEAPILGETLQFVSSIIEEGVEGLEPFNVISRYANLFMFSIISKPLIAAIFSLLGVELGKRAEIILDPTLTKKRIMLKNRLMKEGQLIAIILIMLFGSLTAPATAYSSEDIYTENIVTYVDEAGKIFIVGAFAGNSIQGIDENIFSFEGYLGSILISHKDITDVFYEYMQPPEEVDMSEILNLLPETVVLSAYIDQESEKSKSHSDLIAEELSSYYDMEILELLSFTQKIEEEEFEHVLTINIYQSPLTHEEFNKRYLQRYQKMEGYATTFQEARDYLIPDKIADSVDGSLFMSVYLNSVAFLKLVPVDSSMIPVEDFLSVAFVDASVFVGYWENGARIIKNDTLSINEIFDLKEDFKQSEESDFSSSLIIAPCLNAEGESSTTLKMSSSLEIPIEIEARITSELNKMGLNAEINHEHELDQMEISVQGVPLPLNIDVTRETSYLSPNTINVKIHITNNDETTGKYVVVDDTNSLEKYNDVVIQGNLIMEYPEIKSGETKSYEYTISVDNPGTYIMDPVVMSYESEEFVYNTESSSTPFKVNRPSSLDNLDTTISSITNTSEELSTIIPNNISTAMKLSTYTIILYTIANSIRKLRAWILS